MTYQIKFISGENAGACYKLKNNQSLAIGRSHSNDVCLKSLDISGRHIMIRTAGDSITVEILSSKITRYNDCQVDLGNIITPCSGDKIQMGSNTAFIIEAADGASSNPTNSDDDATVFPGKDNSQDEEKTVQAIPPAETDGFEKSAVPASDMDIKQDNQTLSVTGNNSFHETSESNETIAFQTRT